AADIADAGRRVSIHQDQVRELAGGDGAEVLVVLHDAGGAKGGDAQGLGSRDAPLDVVLQLAMEGEACRTVGAGDDGDARLVESPDHGEQGAIRVAEALLHPLRDRQVAAEQTAPYRVG